MTTRIESLDLNSLKKVHIVGVCGTLMGAFAAFLKRRGIQVSGSDQNVYPPMSDVLRDAGVDLCSGYNAENLLSRKPDLVVIGNVIRSDNPEARAAIDQGFAYSSLPEALEKLMLKQTRNLVVAGTHGKTTISSMLAHVLVSLGKDPNYFIGGVSQDLPFSFHLSGIDRGQLFVLEGDEYDTAFWDKVPKFNHYLPDDVILTSVEFDHADIYPDLAAVVRAFEGLVDRVRSGGRMIACWDYSIVQDLSKRARVPVISYGSSKKTKAQFTPGKVSLEGDLTRFEILDGDKSAGEVSLQVPGFHNALNALSVWVECQQLGLDMSKVSSSLRSFRGVKRRQEVRGEVRGVMVIDDFAHHPTAVRETLRALRLKYPGKRLLTVFEPRSATSRRKIFQTEYAKAFAEADITFIAEPYDLSRIAVEDRFSSETLVKDLAKAGREAHLIKEVGEGVAAVAEHAKSGDLVAVLSNGGFGDFIPKLLKKLL